MSKFLTVIVVILIAVGAVSCLDLNADSGIGYRIGHATGFKLVK